MVSVQVVVPCFRYWILYWYAHEFPIQFIVADVPLITVEEIFVGAAQIETVVLTGADDA